MTIGEVSEEGETEGKMFWSPLRRKFLSQCHLEINLNFSPSEVAVDITNATYNLLKGHFGKEDLK